MIGFEMVFWYWWIFAVAFLVIEMIIPAFFFLSMSVSALITGVIVWLMPDMSSETQLLTFSVLAIVAIVLWKKYGKKIAIISDQPLLNKRGSQYVGRTFNLHEAIENGQGKIKVDDTIWKVHGEDCDIGSKVRVVASRGTVFDVEKVEE